MTLWEFAHCKAGWEDYHRSEDTPPPTMADNELAELGIVGF